MLSLLDRSQNFSPIHIHVVIRLVRNVQQKVTAVYPSKGSSQAGERKH